MKSKGGLLAGLCVGALLGLGTGVFLASREDSGELAEEARASLKAAREALARVQETVLAAAARGLGGGENSPT